MKKIYKFLLMTIVVSSTMFYSCETFELENLASPNQLSPPQADADLLLNNIQLNYRFSVTNFNNISGQLSRIDYFFGRNYFANLGPATLNGPWNNLYSGMIPDIANIEALHSPPDVDLSFHLGISKIMEAHLLMLLVDNIGDVVFSQANNPNEFPQPVLDDDQDVYNAAIALLDEATTLLTGAAPGDTTQDLFYDGDVDKWILLANTLKMRADLTVGNFAAVSAATDVILNTADDFEFKFGTNVLSPDNRHPDYINDYTDSGANIYRSNWLMNLMVGKYGDESAAFGGNQIADPRRRYYFFRENWGTPGNFSLIEDILGTIGAPGDILDLPIDGEAETLQCSLQETPNHLQFTPDEDIWCSLQLGYWGRTHGNDEGIPPDNFTRTAVGVYPAGGSFDAVADAFPFIDEGFDIGQQVGLGNGAGGFGIEPIMLASYVHFMKAEASLSLGDVGAAAAHMEAGLRASIEKVMSFGENDGNADFSQAPDGATVEAFITEILDQFNNAPVSSALDGTGFPVEKDKMDILGEQYFVALYGGSADAFNFIRRTGYPRTLARNIEANPGNFPRTLLYPGAEVLANPNIQQRTDLDTKVFWDQGVLNPAN